MSKPVDFKLDTRIRERMMRRGELSLEEVSVHLQALPDLDGDFEVLSDISQPAVTPARAEVAEEPIVFEGIRRLHAMSEAIAPPAAAPEAAAPEPFRSALAGSMESEISGVGVGAVSAALGAFAAESGASFDHLGQSPFAPLAQAVAAEAAAAEAAARAQEAASLAASIAAAPHAAAPLPEAPVAPPPVPPVSSPYQSLGYLAAEPVAAPEAVPSEPQQAPAPAAPAAPEFAPQAPQVHYAMDAPAAAPAEPVTMTLPTGMDPQYAAPVVAPPPVAPPIISPAAEPALPPTDATVAPSGEASPESGGDPDQ